MDAIYPSPEIYHIGTPSDRTTSEGFRSVLSHGTSSVPSYPTSSPVSFGPGQEMSRRTGEQGCLIHDAYGPELREAINLAVPIHSLGTMIRP